VCYGIVRHEIEKNSITTYESICGNVYEVKRLTLGKVLWEGRYVLWPFVNCYVWLRGYEVGNFSGACELSQLLLSKKISG